MDPPSGILVSGGGVCLRMLDHFHWKYLIKKCHSTELLVNASTLNIAFQVKIVHLTHFNPTLHG